MLYICERTVTVQVPRGILLYTGHWLFRLVRRKACNSLASWQTAEDQQAFRPPHCVAVRMLSTSRRSVPDWTVGSLLHFVHVRRNSSKRDDSRCWLIYLLSHQFRSRLVLQLLPKTLQPIIGILLASTGPSGSSGTATDCGLDGPGVESPWGGFSARPDRPCGPNSPLYNRYRVFPGGKVRPGRAADHLLPSSAGVMEE